jgi:sensor c-di-GMP phosphodiesterase-like protein
MQGYLFSRPLPADEFERWALRARIQPSSPWILMAEEPL